jgi:hypothetical protein
MLSTGIDSVARRRSGDKAVSPIVNTQDDDFEVGKGHNSETKFDEKTGSPVVNSDDNDFEIENGHMQELEVDVAKVFREEGLEDIEGDQSP